MIHILTVHWRSTRWIGPQLEYIRRHTSDAYRVVAAVDPTIPIELHGRFSDVLATASASHEEKLNLLGEKACREASSDDDWLVFIDSDCFPIADWVPPLRARLDQHRLIAVRRDENVGDVQPHPCFCVTTVGFWKRIGGDWRKGFAWKDRNGDLVTDVGGNLLGLLQQEQIDWLPLLRSNEIDRHPVFFGLYGGLVYHHGAGSRRPACRADRDRIKAMLPAWRRRLLHLFGRYDRFFEREVERTGRIGEEIFLQLVDDPGFWRQFMAGDRAQPA